MVRRAVTSKRVTRRAVARFLLVLPASATSAVWAQSPTPGGMPPPPGMSLAESAAARFPQPVRVGVLRGRQVLQPVESQNVLGRVHGVVRDGAGQILFVIALGGWLRFGTRLVAVPADAMVLLGQAVEVAAFSPTQLRAFPTFAEAGTTPLPDGAVIRVGLAKPSH